MIVPGSKKNNSEFDRAEICELVGLFLLHELSTIIPKEIAGLYRDDSLVILRNSSGHNTNQIKKRIIKLFQKHDLKITIEANIIPLQTDFLDVTLNIKTEKHWPFRKPNDQQLYININSNHPPSIKKALPNMILSRMLKLSCNLDNFTKKLFHHIKTQLNKVATKITLVNKFSPNFLIRNASKLFPMHFLR